MKTYNIKKNLVNLLYLGKNGISSMHLLKFKLNIAWINKHKMLTVKSTIINQKQNFNNMGTKIQAKYNKK